jgi:hypothetical protein
MIAGAGVGLDNETGDAVVDTENEFLARGFEAGFVACYSGWSIRKLALLFGNMTMR